jgi:CRISPR-associated protein Csb2
MVGLALRFDLGRYHANPWGAHVNEAAVEWPPSPWRLVRALYAVGRTNVTLADDQGSLDRALTAIIEGPPPVFQLPPAVPGHTRHYIPKTTYSLAKPGETAKIIDAFVAVHPNDELRVWWDAELDRDASQALAGAVERLPYLGRSESVCSAALIEAGPPTDERLACPATAATGDPDDFELVDLLCPGADGSLEGIAISVTSLRASRTIAPPGTTRVTYAVPRPKPPKLDQRRPATKRPTLALIRLHGGDRPGIEDAVAIGQALRSGLQGRFGDATEGGASTTFSGRGGDNPRSDQHRHAHYLTLPDRHGRRADRMAVWAPEGLGPDEVAALATLSYIKMWQAEGRLQCTLAALTGSAAAGISITEEAREWRSFTPFGLVRHPKKRHGRIVDSPEDQVLRELEHRGFPTPERVNLISGSWHRFRSSKSGSTRLERARLYGITVRFEQEVRGPIALGALSHNGLGLMVPARPGG